MQAGDRFRGGGEGGLPSADDLDRAEALRAAVADLPDGQRRAVELYYYAGLPAGQIAGSPGAAKASLHKARRRLRAHITAHRPDLIPVTSRDRQHLSEAITGTRDWTRYQITGRVPADAEHIGFELALAGPGSVWLRNVELARTS